MCAKIQRATRQKPLQRTEQKFCKLVANRMPTYASENKTIFPSDM